MSGASISLIIIYIKCELFSDFVLVIFCDNQSNQVQRILMQFDLICWLIIDHMFNFSSMFNTSRGPQSASISELLSLPNVSLMRLLDQDTFLSEFRSASSSIRDFMNYQRFQQMIELVTQVGDPFDKKRSYKFPLTAAELLSTQSSLVFEKLMPDEGVVVEEEKVVTQEVKESQQEVEIDDEDEDQGEEKEKQEKKEEEGKALIEQVEQVVNEEAKQTKEEDVTAAQGQQEQFGDFVAPVKRTKKVIVKEVVEKVTILKKQYPPLVESLLAYFTKELNYTLTSYCCKILTTVLNKRTAKFLAKFFQSEAHGENLLKHIGSRSVVQFITRLFTIETKEFLDRRLGYFQQVLKALGQPQEIEATSNLSAVLCETLEKLSAHLKTANPCGQLKAYFDSVPQLLVIAVNNLVGEHQAAALYSAPLIAQLLAVLPSELDDSSVDTALVIFVEAALSRLAEAIAAKEARLGVGRTKMLEILNVIAKRPAVKTLLADHQTFLPLLFSLVKAYPLNNILHNQAFKLISSFLPSNHRSVQTKLVEWLKEQSQAEKEKQSGAKKPAKGYAQHLAVLCKQLKETPLESNDLADCILQLTEKETEGSQRDLGGFSTRRAAKFTVMFSKEEILKHHATFLSSAKPAVFQVDLNDPLSNPALMQELQRQLDGMQAPSQQVPAQVREQQEHKAELIQQNDQHKSAFWKVHLDYNVDDLLDELM